MVTVGKTYRVNEIFYSLQGEGRYTGHPMVFVRFSGCQLACAWCDTKHETYEELSAKMIADRIGALLTTTPFVCFTGGEPALQLDSGLLQLLRHKFVGIRFCIETNGMDWSPNTLTNLRSSDLLVLSPKTRYDGVQHQTISEWIQKRHRCKADLKVVWVNDGTRGMVSTWLWLHFDRRYVQPLARLDGTSTAQQAVQFVQSEPGWWLSLQIHKFLGIR